MAVRMLWYSARRRSQEVDTVRELNWAMVDLETLVDVSRES